MRILVQGFGPFGRFPINPSELLVRALPSEVTQPAREPSMAFALQQTGLDTVLDVCRATPEPGASEAPAQAASQGRPA